MDTSDQVENPTGRSIIFFDGYCNLCNNAVNFIIDRDNKKLFLFASLQSPEAKSMLGVSRVIELESIIVLTDQGITLDKSNAALFIANRLSGWFRLLLVFKILPKFFRDWVYSLIARNRYSLFGRKDTCRLPTSELKERFLDAYQNN